VQSPTGAESAGAPPTPDADARIAELTGTPIDADGVTAVALGTAAWAVAGVVLFVFFRTELAADGNSWWLWVCLVGCGLGVLGLPYVIRRRAVYRQHNSGTAAAAAATGTVQR
jgi:hypothetical protein